MKISTIVPVYNPGLYLERCLTSLREARMDNTEIILVNDGSTDGSGVLCKEFADSNEHVKLVSQKNSGSILARKAGVNIAEGEWCTFVDSDDFVEPDYFRNLLEAVSKYPSHDMIGLDYFRVEGETRVKVEAYSRYLQDVDHNGVLEILRDLHEKDYLFSTCNKIYKREALPLKYFDCGKNLGEDTLLNLQVFYHAQRLMFIPKASYNYIFNPDSLTMKSYRPKLLEDMQFYFDQKLRLYRDRDLNHPAYLRPLAIINLERTFYSLLGNLLSEKEHDFIGSLRNIRRSGLITFGFKFCNMADISSLKKKVTLSLFKWNQFRLLKLIYKR